MNDEKRLIEFAEKLRQEVISGSEGRRARKWRRRLFPGGGIYEPDARISRYPVGSHPATRNQIEKACECGGAGIKSQN